MAYTYLDAVNEILVDSNEVQLTSSNFSSAQGVHQAAKNYINKAYLEIIGKEVEWPFMAVAASNTNEPYSGNVTLDTVAGTRWYLLKTGATDVRSDFAKVDWESFYLTTDGVAGETAPYVHENLPHIPFDEWAEHCRVSENKDASGDAQYNQPCRVTQSPDGRFVGLSPIPDKEYKLYFTAWDRATKLSAFDDTILIPDEYVSVLLNRANYYFLHWKKDAEEADRVNILYQSGVRHMSRALIGNPNNKMRDDRVRY